MDIRKNEGHPTVAPSQARTLNWRNSLQVRHYHTAEWDAEIERDFSPGGSGVALLEEMKADARAGKFRPFEEGQPQKH
jgi:hypothetical protein